MNKDYKIRHYCLVIILMVLNIVHISCEKKKSHEDSITDIDGNVYTAVTIGTQIWMTENLKTTHYNDGSLINLITDNTAWSQLSAPGYCWYNNDIGKKETYGALYNWYAANKTNLCPTGWHVSTNDEWITLVTYLGGENIAGGKLKEAGTTHWISTTAETTNSSGFTALPGGSRTHVNGTFTVPGENGYYWAIVLNGLERYRHLTCNTNNVTLLLGTATDGFSVRCVRDN